MMNNLVRVKFLLPNGRSKTVWAEKCSDSLYKVIRKDGGTTSEIVIADKGDVVCETPARMNLHYGELELDEPLAPLLSCLR